MNAELKPCPFCGSTDIRTDSYLDYHAIVQCPYCCGEMTDNDISDAINAWNNRANRWTAFTDEELKCIAWIMTNDDLAQEAYAELERRKK